jgi:hypothetical protein
LKYHGRLKAVGYDLALIYLRNLPQELWKTKLDHPQYHADYLSIGWEKLTLHSEALKLDLESEGLKIEVVANIDQYRGGHEIKTIEEMYEYPANKGHPLMHVKKATIQMVWRWECLKKYDWRNHYVFHSYWLSPEFATCSLQNRDVYDYYRSRSMKWRLALKATEHEADIKGATVIRQWKDCLHWLIGFRNVLLAPTDLKPAKYLISFGELVASLDLHFNLPTPSVEFLHIKKTLEMNDDVQSKSNTKKPYYQTLGTAMKTANLLIKFNADLKMWKWEQVIMKLHRLKWHILASFRPGKWLKSLDHAQQKEVSGITAEWDFYGGQINKAPGKLQTKFNLSSTEAKDLVDYLRSTNEVTPGGPGKGTKARVDYSYSPFAKVSWKGRKYSKRRKLKYHSNFYPEARDMVFVKTKLIQFSDEGYSKLRAMQKMEKMEKLGSPFKTSQRLNGPSMANLGSLDYFSDERESDSMNERDEIKRIYMHGGSPGGDSVMSNSPPAFTTMNSEHHEFSGDTGFETPINKRLSFKQRITDVDTNLNYRSRIWTALNSGNSNDIYPSTGGTPMYSYLNQQNRNPLFSNLGTALSPLELPVVDESKDFLDWHLDTGDRCMSEEKYKYFQILECKIVWTKQVQKAFKDWFTVYWDSENKVYSGTVDEATHVNTRGRVRTSIDIAYDDFFQRDKTYVELFIKLKSGD